MALTTPFHHVGENEARCLLFDDAELREQLISGLSLLAVKVGDGASVVSSVPCEPFKLRLVMHVMEVASKYPMLGTLLLERPRCLDNIVNSTLMDWLNEEVAEVLSGRRRSLSQGVCHHILSTGHLLTDLSQEEEGSKCPICVRTIQWPRAFWEALQNGSVKIIIRCALSRLPSFLTVQAHQLPLQRPSDASIGAEQWIEAIGHVTGVSFFHRESTDPTPMLEFQPLLANSNGVVGQSPLWLDLSFLPELEVRAVAVIGERIQVVGLLEGACSDMGTMLYSKRSNSTSSSVQIVIEVRAVCTDKIVLQYSQDPLMNMGIAATPSSSSPKDFHSSLGERDQFETVALCQARCCWESVAGAAAFASAKMTGGFFREQQQQQQQQQLSLKEPCRAEALFAASRVFVLPTSLWAVVGIVLTSAIMPSGTVAASVVGPLDSLSALQTFLLELGAETNIIVPVVHGMEGTLLPLYSRISASQANLPTHDNGGRRIECVRGGLLNRACQRVLFVPSLHAITPSALHAIQGVLEQHEHVVVREGGQRVTCGAAGAFIGITSKAMPVQHRHLFRFIERGDVVIQVPSSSIHSLEEEFEIMLKLLSNNSKDEGQDEMTTLNYVKRCTSQWNAWCEWVLCSSVNECATPQISTTGAALLHAFFVAAKTFCEDAVDAGMMTTLVKLTCAHALLRRRAHQGRVRGVICTTTLPACACDVTMTECNDFTALIDAVVAIALCDASLNFIAGVSLIGEPSVFDLILSGDHFDIVHYATQLHESFVSHVPMALNMREL